MRICTIAARNYLPWARVLARSYGEHNGGEPCTLLLLDDPHGTVADADEPFGILRPEDVGIERFEGMAAMYDVKQLTAVLKPLLLRHLLERDRAPLGCVDADVRFFDDIDEVARLAEADGIVITPHGGFVAVAPGHDSGRLLDWWQGRLGITLDEVGSVASRFHVVRDPGVNVGYRNLGERVLERRADRYVVNGMPLRSFHFSGFDPARPYALSSHQTRIRLPDEPALARLCEEYADALRHEGFDPEADGRWMYAELADGMPLTATLRRLYGEGERAHAFRLSPFSPEGTAEFAAWCQGTAGGGSAHGLTRAALAVHEARPDLKAAFPDPGGEDGPRFFWWISHHRQDAADLGLPPDWLPLPVPGSEEEPPAVQETPWGVNVAGYLRSELGVGAAARAVITGLDARGIPLMPVHGGYVPRSRQGHAFAYLDPATAPFPINLVCVNADQLPAFLADAGPDFSENRYTIGFWWWEVTTFPDRSLGALDLVDEVWVGSEHVAAALQPVTNVPIVKVRIPVSMPPIVPYPREQLGLPEGYLFFFMFDLHSVLERKNPMGVIEAFRKAFAPGSGASLVIKCINRETQLDVYDRLLLAARGHPDVHIIDRYVSVREKDAMLAACDCYVSLHRSEGFGLTPAEAMYLGKPVIATAYSGNLEYMTPENSYLVDYRLRRVGPGQDPYPADGQWAEPDTDHAAHLMREVVEEPLAAQRRGQTAAADIRTGYSAAAAGETMERRLEHIRSHLEAGRAVRHTGPATPAATGLTALRELIAEGPGLPEGGRARRLAARAVLRLMRPVIVHEQQVSERLASEITATRSRTAAQVAPILSELRRQDALLQSVARLEERVTLLERDSRRRDPG